MPGGRAAKDIVSAVLDLPDEVVRRIQLELIDERLSGERNYDTVMEAGVGDAIRAGRVSNGFLKRMTPERIYRKESDRLDILVASSGEDGHFASLFPGITGDQLALEHDHHQHTRIVHDAPKAPPERVTLTFHGIRELCAEACRVDLLFFGETKLEALNRCLLGDEDCTTLPCRFLLDTFPDITIITDLEIPTGVGP